VELDDTALRVELRELLEPVEGALGPRGERSTDLRFERVAQVEDAQSSTDVSTLVHRGTTRDESGVSIVTEAERKRERWSSRPWLELGRRRGARVVGGHDGYRDDRNCGDGRQGDEADDPSASGHVATIARPERTTPL
jgi:hypothetical protein